MLGHIQSNFHDNDRWVGLSESSYYKSIEPQIAKAATSEVGPLMEKVEDFAKHFVTDILRGASGQVWRGAMAQTVRALAYHAPMRLLVSVLSFVVGPCLVLIFARIAYSGVEAGWTSSQRAKESRKLLLDVL